MPDAYWPLADRSGRPASGAPSQAMRRIALPSPRAMPLVVELVVVSTAEA